MQQMDIVLLLLILITLILGFYMNYLAWIKNKPSSKVEKNEGDFIPPPVQPLTKEIFVTFPCGNCTEQIVVEDFLMPGDIFVTDCENCKTSWSIYNPSLIIKQTKDLPDALKASVAQNMAELHA